MAVLDRLSSQREGATVVDSFYETGIEERYPEFFERRGATVLGMPAARRFERFSRALEHATDDDTSELPDLRIEDDGIGV